MRKYSKNAIFSKINLEEFIDYYITSNHTFYETLDHFEFHSDYFLQEYLKLHNISKQDKHYDKVKYNIDKERLYQYYNLENHSIKECAEYFNSTIHAIKLLIKDYQIRKEQKDVLKIGKKTKLEKYGNENYNNKEKNLATKLHRYGNQNYNNRDKFKNTIIDNYGSIDNYYTEIQKITKNTNKEKYGVNCVFKADDIKTKIKNTTKEKYGVEYYTQSNDFKNKSKQTCLEKYGVDNYSKTSKSKLYHHNLMQYKITNNIPIYDKSKHSRKYTYNNICFDSSWELALYIYLTDNNIDFKYQPNIKLKYEHNGINHFYLPDFLIKGRLVEIKSDYLLRQMIDKNFPYYSEKENKKYQTILDNNIEIISSKEIKPYLDYINKKYGNTYLKSFRNGG